MRTSLLASSLIVLAAVASPAHALFGDDEARRAIVELRSQMQTQQETQMRLYERIETLTKEVKNLRGQLDDLKNSYGKQQNMVGDLNTKIQEMDPKVQANQAAQDRKIQQRQELDNALKLLNQSAYNKAISAFNAFIQKNRGSELYPEAMYWLGSSYYGKGDFKKAIDTESALVKNFPRHAKVPEALLIIGMAQMDTKKTEEAKQTFNQLIKRFPKSEAAKMAKSQL